MIALIGYILLIIVITFIAYDIYKHEISCKEGILYYLNNTEISYAGSSNSMTDICEQMMLEDLGYIEISTDVAYQLIKNNKELLYDIKVIKHLKENGYEINY